jgi:DNA repair protein RecO (recombination protein O)
MPPQTATPALVLATWDYAETSQVAALLTRDFGKVRGLAKGSRRSTGDFQGGLDPGTVVDLFFIRKSEGLDLLTRSRMAEHFPALRRSERALNAAFFVLELADRLTVEHDPQPDFYRLSLDTLRLLDRGAPNDIVLFHFEASAMSLLGYLPITERCALCSGVLPARPAFSPRFGGALCTGCSVRDEGAKTVSAGALRMIARLAEGKIPLEALNVEGRTGREIRAAFDLFWLNLLGREVRSARFL